MMKRWIIFPAALAFIAGFVLLGCSNSVTPAKGPAVIDLAAIPGVTPPAYTENPVSVIVSNAQYSGTVTWQGTLAGDGTFGPGENYTALITLTPKSGYTLKGVTANFFKVAGATTVTNDANSGIVTAVFPATGDVIPVAVTTKVISGVTVPVSGQIPAGSITAADQFTGTISWSPADSPFKAGVVYTATIHLTPVAGYTFNGVTANFFSVSGATSVSNSAGSGTVTAVFPATVDTSSVADFTVTVNNGILHKQNTTQLVLRFSKGGADFAPADNSLTPDNVTITGVTGSATVQSVSTRGAARTVYITVEQEGDVTVTVDLPGITPAAKTAFVFMQLGYQEDSSVNITDIVKFEDKGTPVAGNNISFARLDGDPIAVLAPVTDAPVSSVTASSPAMTQLLATFNPPLDLDTASDGATLKWFDMVWDGLGADYTFATSSSIPGNDSYTYTGTDFSLYSVTFNLDLVDNLGNKIRFQKVSTTIANDAATKNPVRFLLDDLQTGAGLSSWTGSTREISSITLSIVAVQLRDPDDLAWGNLSVDRSPAFTDTWIKSLTATMAPPSPPYVLYDTSASPIWNSAVTYPRYGTEWNIMEQQTTGTPATDGFGDVAAISNTPQMWCWNPINLTTLLPYWPNYDFMVVYYTGSITGFGTGCIIYTDAVTGAVDRSFNWDLNFAGVNPIKIPLVSNDGVFNPGVVRGFGLQFNGGSVTVTKITFE